MKGTIIKGIGGPFYVKALSFNLFQDLIHFYGELRDPITEKKTRRCYNNIMEG